MVKIKDIEFQLEQSKYCYYIRKWGITGAGNTEKQAIEDFIDSAKQIKRIFGNDPSYPEDLRIFLGKI
jgi:tryptophan synthase alpha subunit